MKLLVELSCRFYSALVHLYSDELQHRYGEEMQLVFRDQIEHASEHGLAATIDVWLAVASDSIRLLAPAWAARAGVLAASIAGSAALVFTAAMGFCTIGPVVVAHGYSVTQVDTADPGKRERLVATPMGNMFLTCEEPREIHGINTVILVTGRGIGDHTGWMPVQSAAAAFARVCSYDPIGAGQSDKQPTAASIDDLVEQMHALFNAARLPQPYVLAGTSAGGVLARRYQTRYASEVRGMVFADSSHEEMEWRDAAIVESFSPGWNDAKYLHDNGLLSKGQLLQWHADIPIIVLERGERAPCEAFPGLTLAQCNAINDAWHSFQVDLSHRSKYGELRVVMALATGW